MKKYLSLFILGIILIACSEQNEATIGQYTTIEVDSVFDAGTVAKGEIIKANIKVKNTGDYPLVIANVKGACSCTVTEYEEDPIPPGESIFIKAEVDTDKTGKGLINKSVSIMANTRPSLTKVIIKSKVID